MSNQKYNTATQQKAWMEYENQKPSNSKGMLSWMKGSPKKTTIDFENTMDGLQQIYKEKILPLEQAYHFHTFHRPILTPADFEAKPMILLVGQYSTGKTSFIRYLLEEDFIGMRVGPEPTTDGFTAVMYGDNKQEIPGNALVVDKRKQFQGLAEMGNSFLNRLTASIMNNPVLKHITLIDTPGILSGEKQRINRGYDFTKVIEWFAERVDRIILLFDAHKLDISDEFRTTIECLSGYEDKIRIILNKADMVDTQQLMRVYGALMWSLGKIINTPEVPKVHVSTFKTEELQYDTNRRLFEMEESSLFEDLQSLAYNSVQRKLNDLIKRARLAKVNALLVAKLRSEISSFRKEKKKQELINNLSSIYEEIVRENPNISMGDFPDIKRMQQALKAMDFKTFNPLKQKLLQDLDLMFDEDIPRLVRLLGQEQNVSMAERPMIREGAFTAYENNPVSMQMEGINAGKNDDGWIVSQTRCEADEIFVSLGPIDGKVTGAAAKGYMLKSKLQTSVLGKIWKLSDVDQDGMLDIDEFALSLYLIKLKLDGHELPTSLPDHLVPPTKRH